MSKLLNGFYRLLTVLAAVAMVASLVAVILGVMGREMGFNIRGLDAYAGYAIAAALFLALPETFQKGDHIRVTLVLQHLPQRLKGWFELWGLVSGAGLSAYLSYYAARLVWQSHQFHDVSQSADATPLWIPQVAMALGCLGFALSFLHALVEHFRGGTFFSTAQGEAANIE